MILGIGLLVVSSLVLLAGAELFAEHAAAAGRRLGVTGLAVGLVLAGAEPEELFTAIVAATRGRPGIAVGDAIGANITMFLLALGLAAVMRPVPLSGRVRTYGLGAALTGAAAAAVLADGQIGRPEGVLLVAAYVALVTLIWHRERQPPLIGELAETLEDADGDADAADDAEADEADDRGEPAGVGLLLAGVGIAVMAAGGMFAVQGAERVVDALDVTDTAVGLTLVALATTAELLALAWSAVRRDVGELAVAAVVGSAAYNATATLGAAALVHPASGIDARSAAVAAAILPLLLLARGPHLNRPAGLVLVAVYALYVTTVLT